MTRNRFEAISTFLHIVSDWEEDQHKDHPLRKVLPFYNDIKRKCLELYQPLPELSIDERMVKSKARSHFRQYMKDKPTKWGFKIWVLADPTGYTFDFNLYCGKQATRQTSPNGLAFDVVMDLIKPYHFQGYRLFIDNFYTSPTLMEELEKVGIAATGTMKINRKGVPSEVVQMQAAVKKGKHPRGTGYYFREPGSSSVYVCWHDNNCVILLSTAYPGHQDGTVKRKGKDSAGRHVSLDVALPTAVKYYNMFMGGVDKSDQLIGYYRITRQTQKYWKTIFLHLLEIAATNAFILYKLLRIESQRLPTERHFRDQLVIQIIKKYGLSLPTAVYPAISSTQYRIRHGSTALLNTHRRRCAICSLKTTRNCPDCPFSPALCQNIHKDCHGTWHSPAFDKQRRDWFIRKRARVTEQETPNLPSKRPAGRPRGSTDKKKRKKRGKKR